MAESSTGLMHCSSQRLFSTSSCGACSGTVPDVPGVPNGSKGNVLPRFQWCARNPVELQQNDALGTSGTFRTPGTVVKRVAILGSTGSIGTSALEVARTHPDRVDVVAIAAATNVAAMV